MVQIAEWLDQLGMSEYTPRFVENRVDLGVLSELTDEDLEKMGVCSETVGKCCGQSWPAAPALLGLLSPALVLPTWVEIWLRDGNSR